MTISFGDAVVVGAIAAAILIAIALLALRSTRTLYPIFCVHCWAYRNKRTVIAFSEEEEKWAICEECVSFYWQFREQEGETADQGPSSGNLMI